MHNEDNFCEGSILRNAMEEMKRRKNCCCPRFIPGPTGSSANSASCFCVDQMKNIIKQIITLYLDDNLIVAM